MRKNLGSSLIIKNKNLENNTTAYEELGEYIVNFQQIHHLLHIGLQTILNNEGLSSKKENIISQILFSDIDIRSLIKTYKSLVGELYSQESEDFKILKKVLIFIEDYILNVRNDLVHSYMILDPDNKENLKVCRIKKYGSGLKNEDFNCKFNLLKEQIEIIKSINFILHSIYYNLKDKKQITGDFILGNDKIDVNVNSIEEVLYSLKQNYNLSK